MTAVATTARDRARLIREGLAAVWDLLTAAYAAEDWKTLGYSSWEAYCIGEFQGRIPRLAKSERGGVVQELADHGMPIKAIAAATRIDRNTIRKDLRRGEIHPPTATREEALASVNAARHYLDGMRAALDELRGLAKEWDGFREHATSKLDPGMDDEELFRIFAMIMRPDGTPITNADFDIALRAAATEGDASHENLIRHLHGRA